MWRFEELNQKFEEINVPEEPNEYDTLAGFIINHLGRIPRVNEECVIEEFRFIISKATQSRIETVKNGCFRSRLIFRS